MSASWVASRASSGWPVTRRQMACTRSTCRASRVSSAPRSPALAAAASASSLAAAPASPLTARPSAVVDADVGHLDPVATVDLRKRREPHEDVASAHPAEVERARSAGCAGGAPAGEVRARPVGDVDLGHVPGVGRHLHGADLLVGAAEVEVHADAGLELGE